MAAVLHRGASLRPITHVVIHTAASARDGRPYDASRSDIDAWHKARGWDEIGYHWVVRFSGRTEVGRTEDRIGAGVAGFNAKTIHVCFSGHGDLAAPNHVQWRKGVELVADILRRHHLVDAFKANPHRVLGHREVGVLKLVAKPIAKTCPGRLFDMKAFRNAVLEVVA